MLEGNVDHQVISKYSTSNRFSFIIVTYKITAIVPFHKNKLKKGSFIQKHN